MERKRNLEGRTSEKFEIILRLEDSFHIHLRITDPNPIVKNTHILPICEREVI